MIRIKGEISFIFLAWLVFISCMRVKDVENPKNISQENRNGELIFQSGFEPSAQVIKRGNDADIIGRDLTFSSKNDWVKDLDNHPEIGNFNIQYQGGNESMRFAKIISDPTNPQNHVLHFWLDKPNVEGSKGRIQANLYGNKGWKEFYQSVRIYLHNDFMTVREFPEKIHWLTIAEFWNNVTWDQNVPYGFRITLGIGKDFAGESDLHFILDAQDCILYPNDSQKYTTLWSEINKKVPVPIGEWFTMEYYYKEGNKETGRFYLTIKTDAGSKQIIFDHKGFTHNSGDPNPDGVSDFNPMKLYTSKKLIDYMSSQGKTLQMYWDDFFLWKDKKPH
ncbi:hypothetical protein [Petrimonas sp.]|uniref:hypothetical protein n=1 Tax=Petrimonas sp. TaxID=2023866 RepID=UPI003F5108D8